VQAAKRHAQETKRSLTQLVEAALGTRLRHVLPTPRMPEPLPTYRGAGLRLGVDLSDADALDDLMAGH